MIVINKPFDGVPTKLITRDVILCLFVKPPLVVFLLVSLVSLKDGIGHIVTGGPGDFFDFLIKVSIWLLCEPQYSLHITTHFMENA